MLLIGSKYDGLHVNQGVKNSARHEMVQDGSLAFTPKLGKETVH
jgi:hypothetical protein